MPKCQVQWVDCAGKPTPDENDASHVAIHRASGKRLFVCLEHADVVRRARCHSGECGHITKHPDTWVLEPLLVTYRVELANKIGLRGQAIGNLWGVARYVDGRRNDWAMPPQEDERAARTFAEWANSHAHA